MPRSQGSAGENIQHFSHIRLRIVGDGVLKSQLSSFDDVVTIDLPNYTMETAPGYEPTILTNMVTQRAALKLYTTEKDEYMRVNRVIIFMRDYGSEFPM